MSDELKIAIEAAKLGAKNALKYFDQQQDVEVKEDKTVVTEADKKTEEIIKSYISEKLKKAFFVGEESGGGFDHEEFWTIDPIDGTRSFVRGIPTWCTIVSLCRENEVELTCIYFPHTNETFYAQRGLGAFQDSTRLYVSKISTLSESLMGFGSPRHITNKESFWKLVKTTASSRSWDPTYSGCLLTAGRVDLHLDEFGKIWDLSPFKVMVEEAGGKITRLDGSAWTFEGSGAIMTNGILHDEVVKILNS